MSIETIHEPVYVVGIDLGTTNSVVAYTEAEVNADTEPGIRIFRIPQLVDAGLSRRRRCIAFISAVARSPRRPRRRIGPAMGPGKPYGRGHFCQRPRRRNTLAHDCIGQVMALSHRWWTGTSRSCPGKGRTMGEKLSPVEASAAILAHIRDSWNYAMARENYQLRLENQEIFLTVPASFDAVARNLTVQAAELAGLIKTTLLEEPQAAFYAWIDGNRGKWRDLVRVDDLIMVADVGGGTTDLSLIKVTESDGELNLERVAVGKHLLVGGDNMDLTLAYAVAANLAAEGKKLDAHQMRGLSYGCRSAKEYRFHP